ncbi:uncharacterized protein LOC127788032 [Diospyros lotus]|uniref:uncharacterized protein LOC127788032 n=1 Tax=Diospyros lotus TaxID=55363 RepID=UPI002251E226|nr:uncharacterized protein LOC127788032 [Diospyros lotus]
MDNNGNQLIQVERVVEINERDILVGDFMISLIVENRSSIIYPSYRHDNFQLRPDVINLFSNNIHFYGRNDKNPHYHLSCFLEYCGNFEYQGINEEALKMRLFSHTLKDKAREWLDSLPPGSITTWMDVILKFTLKYFPLAKIKRLKIEISTFQQAESENFHEAWERFEELLRKCPSHGFPLPAQNHYVYVGLTLYSCSVEDSTTGGSIQNKSAGQLHDLFETMSEYFVMWPNKNSHKRVAGMHEVDVNTLMLAKIDALSKLMEALKQQNNPFSQTYNPGWRNHPHFSYGNTQNIQNPPKQGRPHEEKGGLEEAISKLQKRSEWTNATIKNIENQIGQLAKILTEKQLGTWPSNTEVNPNEQVNAITTRSEVHFLKIHVKKPSVAKENGTAKETTDQDDEPKVIVEKVKVALPLVNPYVPPISFPQRLRKHKLDKQFEKFLEVFKKLHINIPFAEALSQMPSYV